MLHAYSFSLGTEIEKKKPDTLTQGQNNQKNLLL